MTIPDITIINLKAWLEHAQSWLHEDGSQDTLQRHHHQLLGMMSQARIENRTSQVWDLMDEMGKLALHMTDTREQGEVFIQCAKTAADLENLKDALRLFQAAESKYKSYPHQHAVTLWMIGCIYWVSHQKIDAISTWQDAISLFKNRQLNVQVDATKAKWYLTKISQLETYLEQAIRLNGLPPYDAAPASTKTSTQNPTTSSGENSEEKDTLRWTFCRISESIPAGGFGPTGFDATSIDVLEISEVRINNEPHLIYSVHQTSMHHNTVSIVSPLEYTTVHVTGTSMNAAQPVPIDDGDYILVHLQNNADDNDIVVAGIFGQDDRATVKRIKRGNGKIKLIPESDDPSHYELDWEKEFSELDGEFRIVGVVEAVFKKKSNFY